MMLMITKFNCTHHIPGTVLSILTSINPLKPHRNPMIEVVMTLY